MAFTRADLIRAGQILADDDRPRSEQVWATGVLNEWREAHAPLLEVFETGLRGQLAGIDAEALVARRLKRTPSVVAKLRKMSTLRLPNMQDIGGIRAVVHDMAAVRKLDGRLSEPPAPYIVGNRVDYTSAPRESGYRSLHLIYRNGPPPPGDGTFQLELQVRTRLQHAWATAVETVDAFQRHTLKAGSGPPEWNEFFFTASAALASLEGCEPHPAFSGLAPGEIYSRTASLTRRLLVRERLRQYSAVMHETAPAHGPDAYFLLRLYPEDQRTITEIFRPEHLTTATAALAMWERRAAEGEAVLVVLVAAGMIDTLRQAYPNYFADTQEFVRLLDEIEALAPAVRACP
jgi:putative GTP pyrophosphokinase